MRRATALASALKVEACDLFTARLACGAVHTAHGVTAMVFSSHRSLVGLEFAVSCGGAYACRGPMDDGRGCTHNGPCARGPCARGPCARGPCGRDLGGFSQRRQQGDRREDGEEGAGVEEGGPVEIVKQRGGRAGVGR